MSVTGFDQAWRDLERYFNVVLPDALGNPALGFRDGTWFRLSVGSRPTPVMARSAILEHPEQAGAIVQVCCWWMREHHEQARALDLATELAITVAEIARNMLPARPSFGSHELPPAPSPQAFPPASPVARLPSAAPPYLPPAPPPMPVAPLRGPDVLRADNALRGADQLPAGNGGGGWTGGWRAGSAPGDAAYSQQQHAVIPAQAQPKGGYADGRAGGYPASADPYAGRQLPEASAAWPVAGAPSSYPQAAQPPAPARGTGAYPLPEYAPTTAARGRPHPSGDYALPQPVGERIAAGPTPVPPRLPARPVEPVVPAAPEVYRW